MHLDMPNVAKSYTSSVPMGSNKNCSGRKRLDLPSKIQWQVWHAPRLLPSSISDTWRALIAWSTWSFSDWASMTSCHCSWGWNGDGQLGQGDLSSRFHPELVETSLREMSICKVKLRQSFEKSFVCNHTLDASTCFFRDSLRAQVQVNALIFPLGSFIPTWSQFTWRLRCCNNCAWISSTLCK